MWLMLALIIAVAAFNTLSALIMVINDKRHDIAILQTLGLSNGRIRTVFLLQGLYNGVLGSLIGVILGLILSWYLNDILALFGAQILPDQMKVCQLLLTCLRLLLPRLPQLP